MSKLAIFATIEVQPGTRDAALKVLLEHRERCMAKAKESGVKYVSMSGVPFTLCSLSPKEVN
jgi:hypothetical protein